MVKLMTLGDKTEEVEREMGAVKIQLEEVVGQVGSVIGQVNSIRDSVKISLELVAPIVALRKENGSINLAEPS